MWILLGVVLIGFLAVGGGRVLALWAREPVGPAVPLIACVMVIAAPQMADMMAAMKSGYGAAGGHNESPFHQLGLGLGVLALGLQAWFWTRAALNSLRNYRDANAPAQIPWQEIWAPRLTLLPTTLIAISPFFMAAGRKIPWSSVPWWGIVSAVAASLLLWFLAWDRRRRKRLAAAAMPPPQPMPIPSWRVGKLFAAAPLGGSLAAWLLFLVGVGGMILAQLAPDFINDHLHTLTASLIALSCLIPVASVLLAFFRDIIESLLTSIQRVFMSSAVPLAGASDVLGTVLLVALPIGGSYVAQAANLYDVRWVGDSSTLVQNRPGIREAVETYLQCHPGGTGRVPAIIIAAEGGASRSAAWTLSVMRMLDARTGGAFGRHIFAITSVSGGSLAAVTYALAQAKYVPLSSQSPTVTQQLEFWDKVMPGLVEVARADLLSSSIARMFTSDMLVGIPSRGTALEQAFEHHWRWEKGFALAELADAGFLASRQGRKCLLHLILNGTDVSSGDRLLTSSIDFSKPFASSDDISVVRPFSAAIDVLHSYNTDIYASAAVLNSARFPLISPPGRMQVSESAEN
jgi:hypothetical protein